MAHQLGLRRWLNVRVGPRQHLLQVRCSHLTLPVWDRAVRWRPYDSLEFLGNLLQLGRLLLRTVVDVVVQLQVLERQDTHEVLLALILLRWLLVQIELRRVGFGRRFCSHGLRLANVLGVFRLDVKAYLPQGVVVSNLFQTLYLVQVFLGIMGYVDLQASLREMVLGHYQLWRCVTALKH